MLISHPQRSDEWLQARQGRVTASLAAACLGLDPYTGPLAAWRRITGQAKDRDTKDMAWGRQYEAEAIREYEIQSGEMVTPTGLWVHDSFNWLAASPDGLVGTMGLVEAKCPRQLPAAIPYHHQIQVAVQLVCTGRAWCDYLAYAQPHHFLARFERGKIEESWLISALQAWYTRYVATKTEPPRAKRSKVNNDPCPASLEKIPEEPAGCPIPPNI